MLSAAWNILCDSAIYLLAGFLLAGLLQAWVDKGRIVRLLGQPRKRTVFLATLVGAPLPLCSCSVLPTALTLRRQGASRGAVLAFLISTPETGVTSIALTYALLGPVMAIVRPVAACITAICAGLVEGFLERRAPSPLPAEQPGQSDACACDDAAHEHGSSSAAAAGGAWPRLRAGLRYAFVEVFDDIFGWIVLGVLVAAAIQTWMPPEWFRAVFGRDLLAMPIMLVIGMVLYVCAEATTPIAAAFIAMGLSPGAALVLLLAGPATNIGTMGVLYRQLGRRTLAVYLASIAVCSLTAGNLFNAFVAASPLAATIAPASGAGNGRLETAGAVVFVALGLLAARRQRYIERLAGLLNALLPLPVSARGLRRGAVAAAAVLYAFSGATVIQPGEVGVHKRFGVIRRADLGAGLHLAWPWPIEQIDRVEERPVRRLVLGYRLDSPNPHEPDTDLNEAWSLVGDENIVDLKAVVHWSAAPGQAVRFCYGAADTPRLVRAVALSVMREELAGASINTAMTTERGALERRIEQTLQRRLDGYECGVRVHAFRFVFAHAPPDVHAAFRDVASALEDRDALIDRALSQEARILPAARAGAAERAEAAQAYALRAVSLARGQAQRFLDLCAAYLLHPVVMRQRLYLETLDKVLPNVRKYLKPAGSETQDLEIWFVGGRGELRPEQIIPPDRADNR